MQTLRMLAAVIGLTIVLVASLAHAGSLIIELTNGREITTSRVWEEGDELKFATSAGTAGVPRTLVKRITTATPVANDKPSSSALSPNRRHPTVSSTNGPLETTSDRAIDTPQAGGNRHASYDKSPDGANSLGAGDAQAYRAKKRTLTSALDAATNTYLEASGARNPEAKQAALDDMRAYAKQIIELGDEVKQQHGGVLPAWWEE